MSAPLNALRGYADREVRQIFERSVELAASLDCADLELASLVGLWAATFVQGDIDGSQVIATRAIELADQVPQLANQAHFSLGGTAVTLGRPEQAVAELGLACELSPGTVSLTVGSRPEVHARAWVAHAWWLLGDDTVAADEAKRAVEDARSANHPYSLAIAHAYGAVTAQLRDDLELLDEHLAELTALCQRHTCAYYREWALVLGGWRLGGEQGSSRIKVGIANLTSSALGPGCRTGSPSWPRRSATPARRRLRTRHSTPPGRRGCSTVTVGGFRRSSGSGLSPSPRTSPTSCCAGVTPWRRTSPRPCWPPGAAPTCSREDSRTRRSLTPSRRRTLTERLLPSVVGQRPLWRRPP
jgi:hypothetical protein